LTVRASLKTGSRLLANGLAGAALLCSVQAALSANCKPGHFRAPYFINTMGPCTFDPLTLSFAGTPAAQAQCLMRGMDATRNLAPPLDKLPAAITTRVGETAGLPSRDALSRYLSSQNLEWDFAAHLWQPDSHARDDDPDAPSARYFVIHDTSGPNYGHRSFPADIDNDGVGFNNLANFACSDGWGRAHVFVNRAGEMLLAHDFSIAWRETKFEQAAEFGGALQGLFVHVELIQPRRSAAGRGSRNDARSPDPAFTAAQYDRLALLYVIASVRAQRWLIPAFHAALDAGIRDGHDDPLNFDIDSFAGSLDRLVEKLQHPEQLQASLAMPIADARAKELIIPYAVTAIDDPPPAPEPSAVQAMNGKDINSAVPAAPLSDAPSKTEPPKGSPGVMVAAKQSESLGEQKTPGETKSVNAEHCKTRFLKGHRRRVCESDLAENGERGSADIRSVDRELSHEGRRARHRGRYVHARHGRGSA
jgi:hypothetical protein